MNKKELFSLNLHVFIISKAEGLFEFFCFHLSAISTSSYINWPLCFGKEDSIFPTVREKLLGKVTKSGPPWVQGKNSKLPRAAGDYLRCFSLLCQSKALPSHLQSAFILFRFVCSLQKWFRFLRGALHTPLQLVLIILADSLPPQIACYVWAFSLDS